MLLKFMCGSVFIITFLHDLITFTVLFFQWRRTTVNLLYSSVLHHSVAFGDFKVLLKSLSSMEVSASFSYLKKSVPNKSATNGRQLVGYFRE